MKILLLVGLILAIIFIPGCISPEVRIEDINTCSSDSECITVASGYCGGAVAINKNYLDDWNKHLEGDIKEHEGDLCKPTLPLDYFEAKCQENKCVAVQIK